MRIAVGADHRGFALKELLKTRLRERGHSVVDMGCCGPDRVDYPDFARKVAVAVARGRARRGILVCSTGIGMSIAANRFPSVRAALCDSVELARLSREHNDANVLCLGADFVTPAAAIRMVNVWLGTRFAGGRHRARVSSLGRMARGC